MNSLIKIYSTDDISYEKLHFMDISDGKIYIKYQDGTNLNPLLFKLEKMNLESDLRNGEINLTLNNNDILNFFNKLDGHMINLGRKNKKNWPFDTKRIKYKMLVRDDDIIKIKIDDKTLFYDSKKKLIKDYNHYFQKNTGVKILLEIESIIVMKNVYYLNVIPHQVMALKKKENKLLYELSSESDS